MTQQPAKERPIILKAHEVRAILDGTQTVLWRPLRKQPQPGTARVPLLERPLRSANGEPVLRAWFTEEGANTSTEINAPCKPGDRLWVRETFFVYASGEAIYRADYGPESYEGGAKGWSSSAQMPRYHSRITLEVLDVRPMRVQDVTEGDVRAAGVDGLLLRQRPDLHYEHIPLTFRDLWDADNPRHPYAVNPWAWRVEVKRITP